MNILNKFSKVITPWRGDIADTFSVSLSQKLLNSEGFTQYNGGLCIISPLLMKSLGKLKAIVRKEMKEISALEVSLPILTDSKLFKTSGRHELPGLFEVDINDNKSYILSPTCEEASCNFISSLKMLNHKHLPIRFYQISSKFRDEIRPRSGLLRAKEFLMKDLYCFDSDDNCCEQCYQEVINQYHHFFDLLKVPYICAVGTTGDIGGLKSHEFHFLANAGQDKVILCQDCGFNVNLQFADNNGSKCLQCKSDNVLIRNAIEVGHAFKIGTKFTAPFEATYINEDNTRKILHMSSFGLGLTRILAASVEVLSKPNEIKWPTAIAPYLICIIPPKVGSSEEIASKDAAQLIYYNLNQLLEDDVIIDDRTSLSIGKRIQANKKLGFPFQVVLGKSMCDSTATVEVIDTINNSTTSVQIPDVTQYISDKISNVYNQNIREKIVV